MNDPRSFQKPSEMNGLLGDQSNVDPEEARKLRRMDDESAVNGMRDKLSAISAKPLDEATIKPAEAEAILNELESRITVPENPDGSKK